MSQSRRTSRAAITVMRVVINVRQCPTRALRSGMGWMIVSSLEVIAIRDRSPYSDSGGLACANADHFTSARVYWDAIVGLENVRNGSKHMKR